VFLLTGRGWEAHIVFSGNKSTLPELNIRTETPALLRLLNCRLASDA
jgi:hypothetical protein